MALADNMTERTPTEGFTIADILRILAADIKLLAGVTFLFLAVFTVVAFILPPRFTSKVIFAPVPPPFTNDARGTAAGGLSTLSKLAGIAVSGGGDDAALNVALLESKTIKREFIKKNDLLTVLFADQWDAEKEVWKPEYADKPPTIEQGVNYLESRVMLISPAKAEGIYTLSVEWKDPRVAAVWANDFIGLANQFIRQNATETARKNVAYLSSQFEQEKSTPIREALSELLVRELRTLALANSHSEYAFRIIEKAVPAETKSKPKRLSIILLGFLTGFASGAVFLLIRHSYRRQ